MATAVAGGRAGAVSPATLAATSGVAWGASSRSSRSSLGCLPASSGVFCVSSASSPGCFFCQSAVSVPGCSAVLEALPLVIALNIGTAARRIGRKRVQTFLSAESQGCRGLGTMGKA